VGIQFAASPVASREDRSLQVGGEVSISIAEQKRQVHALHALDSALDTAVAGGRQVEGLVVNIYHPDADAVRSLRLLDPKLSASLSGPSKVAPPPPSTLTTLPVVRADNLF
jgi:hypothetical protein